jgi:maltose-binding protein MalE
MYKRSISIFLVTAFLFLSASCNSGDEGNKPIINLSEGLSIYESMPNQGVLTVAVPYFNKNASFNDMILNRMLPEARTVFKEKYTGWEVNIISVEDFAHDYIPPAGETRGGPSDTEAYYSALPDALFNSDGIDVIAMSSYRKKPFMDAGLLQDMAPLFSADEDTDITMLLPGIRRIVEYNRVYNMPISFYTTALVVNTTSLMYDNRGFTATAIKGSLAENRADLSTWEEIAVFFKPEMERVGAGYLLAVTPQGFVARMLAEEYVYIYDEYTGTYNYDNIAFKELAQTAYWLSDNGFLPRADTEETLVFNGTNAMLNGSALTGGLRDYINLTSLNGLTYLKMPAFNDAKGIAAWPVDEYAINANSPNITAAWEFIKILLSPALQNSGDMLFQPVLSEVDEQYIKRATGLTSSDKLSGTEFERYNLERFNFLSDISHMGAQDELPILDILNEQLTEYFMNTISLDEMIDNLRRMTDGMD